MELIITADRLWALGFWLLAANFQLRDRLRCYWLDKLKHVLHPECRTCLSNCMRGMRAPHKADI